MKNSTGSVLRPNYPDDRTRDFREEINSLSFGIPSPVTFEIENIGQTTLSGIAFAMTEMSSFSSVETTIGFLPAYGEESIFCNVAIVSSRTFLGAISILVTTTNSGTPRASDIPKCSLVILLTPILAPTTIIE